MSAKICSLCQVNMALELSAQLRLYGTSYEDENGEPVCVECVEEMLEEKND